MSIFYHYAPICLESLGITTGVLMELLNIERESAEELLDGTIPLTTGEMEEIAQFKGVSLEMLVH